MLRPLSITLAALLLASCAAEAEEPASKPALELTGRVVDAASILSPSFESTMTDRLARLEDDTSVQLVVATTPSLNGHDIADYATDLGNAWGLGDEDLDNGLLLLVAPNERKVRIAVGYGLEASVKDDEAAQIIQQDILPHFRQSNYEAGVGDGVDSLIDEVTPYELKEAA